MRVIGIDASYTRTGLSCAEDGELIYVSSIKFKGCKTKPEKRLTLAQRLQKRIDMYQPSYILVERTRQFSTSEKDKQFIAMNMIKTGISIQTCIVDVAYRNGLDVYSVDTRSWKAQVVGTSKPKNGNKKLPALEFVQSLGFDVYDDDDAADSACIALFPWYAKNKIGLEKSNKLMRLEQ